MSINTTNQKPENYLIWAILSTLFCCLPLGIVAVVKANQVDSLWLGQRYDEALAASNEAKKWTVISAISGIVVQFISYLILFIIMLFA